MPKAAMSRTPYRFSIPSPPGLLPRSQFYGRSSPSTPSPPSKRATSGALHEFASIPSPGPAVKEEVFSPSIPLASPFGDGNRDEPDGLVPPTPPTALGPRRGSRTRLCVPIRYRSETISVPGLIREAGTTRNVVRSARHTGQLTSARQGAGAARGQLRRAQAEIEKLEARVACLERSERRLKFQVAKEKDLAKDIRVEVEESRAELARAEEKLDEMEVDSATLLRDYKRYRGWWLTENHSLTMVLREVPKRKWDAGLKAIASSSQGRYSTYSANGRN